MKKFGTKSFKLSVKPRLEFHKKLIGNGAGDTDTITVLTVTDIILRPAIK